MTIVEVPKGPCSRCGRMYEPWEEVSVTIHWFWRDPDNVQVAESCHSDQVRCAEYLGRRVVAVEAAEVLDR